MLKRAERESELVNGLRRVTSPGPVFVLIAAAIGVARLAAANGIDHLWTDDSVFLHDATTGGAGSILETYAGYIQVAPRLLALALAWAPLEFVPIAYMVASVVVAGVVASFVAGVSRGVIHDHWCRAACGMAVALLPAAGFDTVGALTYIQWYLLLGAAWAVIGSPATSYERWAGWVLLVTAALSAPVAIALLPMALWRRDRRNVILLGVALAVQAVGVLTASPNERSTYPHHYTDLGRLVQTFFGFAVNGAAAHRWEAGILPTTVVMLIAITAGCMLDRSAIRDVATIGATSFLLWAAAYLPGGAWSRYAIPVAALAVAAVLVATRSSVNVSRLFAGGMLFVMLGSFAVSEYRASGPKWSDEIDAAVCVDGTVALGVSPTDWGTVELPCSALD